MKYRYAIICALFAFAITACAGQKADSSFDPVITSPVYPAGAGPTVCIDEAHYNSHTATGLYRPFAKLVEADGFKVERAKSRFTSGVSSRCRIVVVVNAAGGKTWKVFGLNLPTPSRKRRHLSAFSRAEIDTLLSWVKRGGSLLLIADHHPYGAAAAALSHRLGVDMSGGFTEASNWDRSGRDPGQLVYSRENGLLANHPILNGKKADDRIHRVVSFTGQSLRSPSGQALLILGDSATDFTVSAGVLSPRSAQGHAQGIALELEKGRVVVLGEAAMLTAQVDDSGRKFGMQVAGNDNRQLALNIMYWLVGIL